MVFLKERVRELSKEGKDGKKEGNGSVTRSGFRMMGWFSDMQVGRYCLVGRIEGAWNLVF